MNHATTIPAIFTAALLMASGAPALAVPVLDQEYDPASIDADGKIGQANTYDWAQTFTVGVTGTLTRVDVKVSNDDADEDLLFDVRTTTGGAPEEADSGSTILESVTIARADVPGALSFLTIDLSGIAVTAGDILAITLRSETGSRFDYRWGGTAADGYAGGSAFTRTTGAFASDSGVADLAFRTYVEPASPAPEPATLVIFGLALAGMGLTRRRRDT